MIDNKIKIEIEEDEIKEIKIPFKEIEELEKEMKELAAIQKEDKLDSILRQLQTTKNNNCTLYSDLSNEEERIISTMEFIEED